MTFQRIVGDDHDHDHDHDHDLSLSLSLSRNRRTVFEALSTFVAANMPPGRLSKSKSAESY